MKIVNIIISVIAIIIVIVAFYLVMVKGNAPVTDYEPQGATETPRPIQSTYPGDGKGA